MDLHLQNQVALVTGGGHGLGRAICLALAAEGAAVAVNYRRGADEAQRVVAEITERFRTPAIAIRADVASERDVLVNNAAVCPTRQLKDMPAEEWCRTVQVNLTGTFFTCREMVRRLAASGRPGRIVNVSSQAAFRGSTTGHAPYDASKGGIVSLTVSLAREVAPLGIAVNAVAPGMMRTEMTAKTLDDNPAKYLGRIPLGRIGDVAEVANVVVFLASSRASYMTGATVDVSGGMLMR